MGKGYNNFMSKKAFHPGSFANQKRVQEAEARAQAKRKHDEETAEQYRKEQELFQQTSLVSNESKEKLSLNFMYQAPPGLKKPEDTKQEKVEWKGQKSGTSEPGKPSSSKGAETNICLEWKRDRPKRIKKER